MLKHLAKQLKKLEAEQSMYINYMSSDACDWSDTIEIKNVPFNDGEFELIVAFDPHCAFEKCWCLQDNGNKDYIRIASDIIKECKISKIESYGKYL